MLLENNDLILGGEPMISFDIFLVGMFVVSAFTGLATEAAKQVLSACKKSYNSNVLSGIVAVILSIGLGVFYVILNNITFTAQIVACIGMLAFLSWLCAMVGYDKVIQIVSQFKTPGKGR